MHRKRVTYEVHDSYFRLMTIKNAIPMTAERTHPGGQSWGDIEWAIELLYNSVNTGSHSVGVQMSWWQDVVEKDSRKLSPQASGWASRERERYSADGHKSGGQYVAVLFGLHLPLTHTTLSNKVRGIFFFIEVFARLLSLCRYDSACIYVYVLCVCIVNHGHGYCVTIQQLHRS